jgi:hypothetical protein
VKKKHRREKIIPANNKTKLDVSKRMIRRVEVEVHHPRSLSYL